MKEEIEKIINAQLDTVETTDEELIRQIEEKIKEQNMNAEEKMKRRKIIKSFLENNHIRSLDELSDEQLKNILKYKV